MQIDDRICGNGSQGLRTLLDSCRFSHITTIFGRVKNRGNYQITTDMSGLEPIKKVQRESVYLT
jgi:hypothetical protein